MSSKAPGYGSSETREHILRTSWALIADQDSTLKLTEVARAAKVSRQALYLHFGDRAGLVLALVRHMDETLDLGRKLAHVRAADSGGALLERAMQLSHSFWEAVYPVARILEAAQEEDPALGKAWRDRMAFRQNAFAAMIARLVELGELSEEWEAEDAAGFLYGATHLASWREMTHHLGWSEARYVAVMSRALCRALLKRRA